jgi:KUP system potassium uptake protein
VPELPAFLHESRLTEHVIKVIGVLSLVIWALILMVSVESVDLKVSTSRAYTIQVTVKYIFIVLHADNQGEGGTFSCYSLLSRYANITNRDPREEPLVKLERWKTEDMHRSNLQVRKTIERSRVLQVILKVVGVLAVSSMSL